MRKYLKVLIKFILGIPVAALIMVFIFPAVLFSMAITEWEIEKKWEAITEAYEEALKQWNKL